MRVFVTDLDFVWNKRHLSSALKSWSMNGEKSVSHTNMLKTTLRSTNIALEHVTFRPIKMGDFPDQIVGLPEGSSCLQGPLGEIPARLALLLFTCNDFGLWRIPEDVKKDPQTKIPTRPTHVWHRLTLPGFGCFSAEVRTCWVDVEDINGWNIPIWLSDLVKFSIDDSKSWFNHHLSPPICFKLNPPSNTPVLHASAIIFQAFSMVKHHFPMPSEAVHNVLHGVYRESWGDALQGEDL